MTFPNLLPWREQWRLQRQRRFLMIIGASFLMSCLIILLVHISLTNAYHRQRRTNNTLVRHIQQLHLQFNQLKNLQNRNAKLQAKLLRVATWHAQQSLLTHLLPDLAKTVPEGVFLTHVEWINHTFVFAGKIISQTQLTEFMHKLSLLPWITQPQLEKVQADVSQQDNYAQFTLKAMALE